MATANIVTCPPVYTDMVMTTPPQSTLIYGTVSEALAAQYNANGCTIKTITVPDSFVGTAPTVEINTTPVVVTPSGGTFTWDGSEDQTQDVDITLDNGSGATVETTYTYYDPYLYLRGNTIPALSLYSKTSENANVYKLNSVDGTTEWSINNSIFEGDSLSSMYNFAVSDDGVVFFVDNKYAATTDFSIYRIDTAGTVTTVWTSTTVNKASYNRFVAFDRTLGIFHALLEYPTKWEAPWTKYTHVTFNKAGGVLSTTSYSYTLQFLYGLAVDNGNVWVPRNNSGNTILCGFSSIASLPAFTLSSPYYIAMVASKNGYCYALFYDDTVGNCKLMKLSAAGSVWTYSFSPTATSTGFYSNHLTVNDDGESFCNVLVGGVAKTFHVKDDGTLDSVYNDTRSWIDNNGGYYKST